MKGIRLTLASASLAVLAVGTANAQTPIAFSWAPPTDNQTVTLGTSITVALWAMPTSNPILNISGFEAVVSWNTAMLGFMSYTPFASPNNSFTDGTGIGDLSIFDFSPSFSVPAGGTHLGDLTFLTLAGGDTQVGLLGSGVIDTPSGSFGGETKVYRLATFGGDIVPDYTSVANIHIGAVPEPASVACLGIGLALLLRYRRRRA
ncbi:MAG TPA: PEP-CTERM sorting domain-containing protein [Fimbriimonadaceae bacterium]|nr:PEP-CTERM sorting domain-containing protein [Fimbriimonadaceae bacterium]